MGNRGSPRQGSRRKAIHALTGSPARNGAVGGNLAPVRAASGVLPVEGVRYDGEVQACGEAHEAAGDVLDVPFDGRGGLGLNAADEGSGIAEGRGSGPDG